MSSSKEFSCSSNSLKRMSTRRLLNTKFHSSFLFHTAWIWIKKWSCSEQKLQFRHHLERKIAWNFLINWNWKFSCIFFPPLFAAVERVLLMLRLILEFRCCYSDFRNFECILLVERCLRAFSIQSSNLAATENWKNRRLDFPQRFYYVLYTIKFKS